MREGTSGSVMVFDDYICIEDENMDHELSTMSITLLRLSLTHKRSISVLI